MNLQQVSPVWRCVALMIVVAIVLPWKLSPGTHLKRETIKLPLRFELNEGLQNADVRFLSRGAGNLLLLKSAEADFFAGRDRDQPIRIRLQGTNPEARAEGLDPLQGVSHYLTGKDPARWRTNVPNYAKVGYHDIYPGIDLVFYGRDGQLEYDFIVDSNADPAVIDMAIDGAKRTFVNAQGDLIAESAGSNISLHRPFAYQQTNDGRRKISSRYMIDDGGRIRLQIGAYDHAKPLIIDPVVEFATFFGGSGSEIGAGIAVDSSGNVYLTGQTSSLDFPGQNPVPGASGSDCRAGTSRCVDIFVTKLSADGQRIIFSTTIGGSADDTPGAIAVDPSGNIYVTGLTYSADFPTVNAFQPMSNFTVPADPSAFVLKLAPSGSAFMYSTYFGSDTVGLAIASDQGGNAYVGGYVLGNVTRQIPSVQTLFPYGGKSDGFVGKLNPAGTPVYSTYVGGSEDERVNAIAVDAAGNAYIGGSTNSPNLPTTAGAIQRNWVPGGCPGGFRPSMRVLCDDGFVMKLNADGTALQFSTYIGGSGLDAVNGIAVDSDSNVYITGFAQSSDFPVLNSIQPFRAGDVFISKLKADGTALLYSTFLGGSGSNERGNSIAVDAALNVIVGGLADPNDFPLVDPVQPAPTFGGFVAKLHSSGRFLVYSTYFGSDLSEIHQIALGPDGSVYGIYTAAYQRPNFFTYRAIQPSTKGLADAFVFRISETGSDTVYAVTERGAKSWMLNSVSDQNTIGFARLQPSAGSFTPAGVAIIDSRVNGVLINETAVPASPGIQSGRIDAETTGVISTGVAMANPNDTPARVDYFYTDANGNDFGRASWTIPANGQIARFLNDSSAQTFSFTANVTVGVVALRGYVNERSEFLTSILSVADLASTAIEALTIPQFADGGGWTTEVILVNPGDTPLRGTVRFSGPVVIDGSSSSSVTYSIAARSSVRLNTAGNGEIIQTGYITVQPSAGNRTPFAQAFFTFKNGESVVSQAGVPAERPSTAFRLFAETSGTWGQIGSMQTGIAIANASASQPVSVQVEVYSFYGESASGGSATIALAPGGQRALFLNEIPFVGNVGSMQGLLRVSTTTGSGITVIGLRGRYNERGDFLMATLPVIDEMLPPITDEWFFPHLDRGGGYTTQIALFGRGLSELPAGKVIGFSQSGSPLKVNGQ